MTRALWVPYAPQIPYITKPAPIPDWLFGIIQRFNAIIGSFTQQRYTRVPTSFRGDMEAGMSSSNFNLAENIEAGDSRAGLDDNAKMEVQRLMKERRVDFDEARRLWVQDKFGRNDIGADGRPRDPKAFMFDR